jgi:hypothetical protein
LQLGDIRTYFGRPRSPGAHRGTIRRHPSTSEGDNRGAERSASSAPHSGGAMADETDIQTARRERAERRDDSRSREPVVSRSRRPRRGNREESGIVPPPPSPERSRRTDTSDASASEGRK